MRTAIADVETDGLLDTLTRIHSLCFRILETGELFSCTDDHPDYMGIEEGLAILAECDVIVFHNGIKFDLEAIRKVYPDWTYKGLIFDTLVASQLIYSDMKEKDFNRRALIKKKHGEARMNKVWPGHIIGRHGLDAWGIRLGEWKGDYAKIKAEELKAEFHRIHMIEREKGKLVKDCPPKAPTRAEINEYVWSTWNQEMQDYCEQDIAVTQKLYELLLSKAYSEEALELEHDFAFIIRMMEVEGYPFNVAKAEKLEQTLRSRMAAIQQELQEAFPPWEVKTPFIPKRDNKKMGYVAGKTFYKVKTEVFNPGSRDHIADRLTSKYKWEPKEFTETGKPKVDEDVLKDLDYPEAALLSEAMMISKRLGQIADGNQAWLKLVTPEGKIHHEVATNGAVTGRCTHKRPNVAQTPSAGAPYGPECRECWGPPEGMVQVGADLSGLELRCLAHFMALYDEGAYTKELLEGDIHTANQQAAGLPTRDNAKTFIYGFLYGAGPEKIGSIVGKGAAEGKKLIASFLDKTPALKKIREAIQKVASPVIYEKKAFKSKKTGEIKFKSERVPNPNFRGYLIGLDGRNLPVRSAHAALNTLLQSAGALISKKATVLLFQEMERRGYLWGTDWALMAHVHDEVQCWARPEIAEELGEVCVLAFEKAGEHFKFRCPITGEFKIGQNWYDTH